MITCLSKTCRTCSKEKLWCEFYTRPNGQPMAICKPCHNLRCKRAVNRTPAARRHRYGLVAKWKALHPLQTLVDNQRRRGNIFFINRKGSSPKGLAEVEWILLDVQRRLNQRRKEQRVSTQTI